MTNKEKICHDLAVAAAKTMFENATRLQDKESETSLHFQMLKFYKTAFRYFLSKYDSTTPGELD